MWHRFKHSLPGGEVGFTLIELIIVVAIAALIFGGISHTFYQAIRVTAASNNHMQTILYVQNVGQWIIRDGQQAQTVDTTDVSVTGGTRKLRLAWDYSQYGQGKYTIDYILQTNNQLRRTDNITGMSAIIAQNITTFSANVSAAGYYQVMVGSAFGGFQQQNAQLVYYFKCRVQ